MSWSCCMHGRDEEFGEKRDRMGSHEKVGSVTGWDHLRNLDTDEMMILKCVSREMIFQMLTGFVCLKAEVSDKILWMYMNTVKIFYIIYSLHSDWIKLFIHDTNERTFDMCRYSLSSLQHHLWDLPEALCQNWKLAKIQ